MLPRVRGEQRFATQLDPWCNRHSQSRAGLPAALTGPYYFFQAGLRRLEARQGFSFPFFRNLLRPVRNEAGGVNDDVQAGSECWFLGSENLDPPATTPRADVFNVGFNAVRMREDPALVLCRRLVLLEERLDAVFNSVVDGHIRVGCRHVKAEYRIGEGDGKRMFVIDSRHVGRQDKEQLVLLPSKVAAVDRSAVTQERSLRWRKFQEYEPSLEN